MTEGAEAADPFETRPPRGQSAPARPEATPVFPIAAWERYPPVRFLGEGGMGRVFLARDPRLHRDVAIKVVRGDDPSLVRRLVLEARAQARVEHPRVCQVYEVGEVSGHVYIAMQLIEGPSLGALAAELNVAEKAVVVREAALGVHEAHRAGIVHRDLKPSNILVERAEDGSLKPYVVDFGLAWSPREGTTVTGEAVGTPHYMSPEQARGDRAHLDRRTDVYSLGATLYHVLAGEPPIPGDNALAVLDRVATHEPAPLRAAHPNIPVDLESIVFKCLEKDPDARYGSARALAADLDRFLNGEPVEARATGMLYRWKKRLARHRRAAAAGGAALVIALGAVGVAVKSRVEAAGRERDARRFTEIVERIEATARYSGLSPLHDTRPDREALRARMAELEAAIRDAGPDVAGPGHDALGRGALALDDEEAARRHFELAWEQGYREPRVAFSLAIVLGNLYQAARLETERIQDPHERAARRREAERRHRDPALAYLRQARGADAPAPGYLEALLASYEDRLDDALRLLDEGGEATPWSYEVAKLRGEVLSTRASRRWNSGQRAGALADFEAGRAAFARAAAIGESVAAVHVAAAELEYGQMVMGLYGGGEVEASHARGAAAIERALAVDPERYGALVLGARFHRRLAEHRIHRGAAAEEPLGKAMELSGRAVALSPERPAARMELGLAHWQLGQARSERGEDPRDALRRAVEIFDAIPEADRDYGYHENLGLVFDTWADHEAQRGEDAQLARGKAIEAYRRATALDEGPAFAWLNLGNAYLQRAAAPRSEQPDDDLRRALEALSRAREANPEQVVAYVYAGDAHVLSAQRQRARGGDAGPDLARALALYREGSTRAPGLAQLQNGAGAALLEQAREAWDHGRDPAPLLRDAQAAFETALAAAPEQGFAHHNIGEALVQTVEYTLRRGGDPRPAAALALPAARKAIAALPALAPPRANLGTLHALLATFTFEQGRDPTPGVRAAEEALSAALERNPEDAQSHRYLGEARTIAALHRARQGQGAAADFDAAEAAHLRAVELSPADSAPRLAAGHFFRLRAEADRAARRDPEPALGRGLSISEELLAARPGWAEAQLLRGTLRLLAAEGAPPPERKAQAAAALEDIDAALARNPNLAPRFSARARAAAAIARP